MQCAVSCFMLDSEKRASQGTNSNQYRVSSEKTGTVALCWFDRKMWNNIPSLSWCPCDTEKIQKFSCTHRVPCRRVPRLWMSLPQITTGNGKMTMQPKPEGHATEMNESARRRVLALSRSKLAPPHQGDGQAPHEQSSCFACAGRTGHMPYQLRSLRGQSRTQTIMLWESERRRLELRQWEDHSSCKPGGYPSVCMHPDAIWGRAETPWEVVELIMKERWI